MENEKNSKYDITLSNIFKKGIMNEILFKDFVEDETIKIEVKSDYRATETGNIYIEYSQNLFGNWVDSGINVTSSNYWIHSIYENDEKLFDIVLPTEFLKKRIEILERLQLLKIIEKPQTSPNEYATKGYLIPLQFLYTSPQEVDENRIIKQRNVLRRAQARQEKISPKSNGKMPD